MGYEVSRLRVYGPEDLYCSGSGISVLRTTLAEAEATFDDFCKNDGSYPFAVFITDGSGVIKQFGPSLAEVESAMFAAVRRRRAT